MLLTRHFLPAFACIALLVSAPANADDANDVTTAVVFWEYANCTLDRDKWRAELMLSAPRNSDARKKATRDLALKNSECLKGGGKLKLTSRILHDTVAGAYVARYYKHAVATDFTALPELYSEEWLNRTTEPKARFAIGLRRFAECVSRNEYALVAALLATKPYSDEEAALFGQLGDTMNSCIPVEQGTKLGFGRLDLRARLGSVAYELAAAAKLEPSNA
ncbi:MAG: hypothetical protein CVT76_01370 [Alphaproteobacteria bacterium HGW-Alphaproteobacteria-15]|nr:MAG: hypothetical protein CVT76_01370 [Alphaproteobacteria bacterium HGW-Alphaproteobacteria-15]